MHKKLQDLVDHFSGHYREIDIKDYGLELSRRTGFSKDKGRAVNVWLEIEGKVYLVEKYLHTRVVPSGKQLRDDPSLLIDYASAGELSVYEHLDNGELIRLHHVLIE